MNPEKLRPKIFKTEEVKVSSVIRWLTNSWSSPRFEIESFTSFYIQHSNLGRGNCQVGDDFNCRGMKELAGNCDVEEVDVVSSLPGYVMSGAVLG